MIPCTAMALLSKRLDLDVHAHRKLQLHQGVHGLGRRLEDVEEALVRPHLELLARLLVDVRRAVHGEPRDRRRQGDRARDLGTGAPGRVDDLARRLVQDPVVEGLEADPNLVVLRAHFLALARNHRSHVIHPYYSRISTMVSAPTVRPPSRMANRRPFSMAMGVIRLISRFTLSPGITISTPLGNCAVPVTSVVRKKNCGRYPLKNGVCRPPSSFVRMYACAVNFRCGVIEPGFAHTCPRSTSFRSVPRSSNPTLSPACP